MRSVQMLAATAVAAACLNAQGLPDFAPPTPLFESALKNDAAGVKRLLAEGANPNEANFVGFPPTFIAAFHQNLEMLQAMVKSGADVKATDRAGSSLLMWAAYNETGNTALVEELIRLGADPNHKNQAGETALMWALRRGHTPVVDVLKKAGASDTAMIKESVEKALGLLHKSGPQFLKVSGCASCHHQSLPQMATGLARDRGFTVDEQAAQQLRKAVVAMYKPIREPMLKGMRGFPDPPITVSYALIGLAADGYEPDDTTRAMAHLISTRQLPDGRFAAFPMRPPMELSDVTATALSLRALQLYGESPEEKVQRALGWLLSVKPKTSEERSMRLLGLAWGKADTDEVRKAAQAILAEQQPDGGWAQISSLSTDAYATGQALVALNLSGQVSTTDPAYQRGVAYLLRTQLADGSWLVRTRVFPFQVYKESGFPHGKDQWISASGTGWAAMALALTAPPAGTQISKAASRP